MDVYFLRSPNSPFSITNSSASLLSATYVHTRKVFPLLLGHMSKTLTDSLPSHLTPSVTWMWPVCQSAGNVANLRTRECDECSIGRRSGQWLRSSDNWEPLHRPVGRRAPERPGRLSAPYPALSPTASNDGMRRRPQSGPTLPWNANRRPQWGVEAARPRGGGGTPYQGVAGLSAALCDDGHTARPARASGHRWGNTQLSDILQWLKRPCFAQGTCRAGSSFVSQVVLTDTAHLTRHHRTPNMGI